MKRMKLLMVCLLVGVLLLPAFVLAGPYLCCDPMSPEVTEINVDVSGNPVNVPVANIVIAGDGAWCLVDLSPLAGGNYTAKAQAIYGQWGPSSWSADFLFTKPVINVPAGIRLGQP